MIPCYTDSYISMTILVRLLTTPSQRSYLVKLPASRTNLLRLDSAISVQTEGAPGSVTTESWKLEKTSKTESNPKGNSDRSTIISLSTTSTCFWNISRDGEWDLWLPDTSWQFRQTFSIKKGSFLKALISENSWILWNIPSSGRNSACQCGIWGVRLSTAREL